jgi:biopolymer transport protein ExbD
MRNNPVLWIFVGLIVGILLTIVGVSATGGFTSALYWQRAAAAEQRARLSALDAEREAVEAHQHLLDAERRAAEDAKPQPEFRGATVVIDLINNPDGLILEVGDGVVMRPKDHQALPDYFKAMRREGKKQAELRVDAGTEWKSASDVIEEARKAGFEKITLQTRPQK